MKSLFFLSLASVLAAAHKEQSSGTRLLAQGYRQPHNDEHHHHHHDEHDNHHHDHEMCGYQQPSRHEEIIEQVRLEGARAPLVGRRRRAQTESYEDLCRQCITIKMRFHLILADVEGFGTFIPHPEEAVVRLIDGGDVGPQDFSNSDDISGLIRANVDVLNVAFADTPFVFAYDEGAITETANTDWTVFASEFKADMSRELGSDDLSVMDVFISLRLQSRDASGEISGGGTLGFAILPFAQLQREGDGVFLRYDVLTNGGNEGFSYGYAFVHEAAHWLGLYHTFNTDSADECDPDDPNDFVADTPIQNGPTVQMVEDCTVYLSDDMDLLDTCPGLKGVDPIFNYLNYLDNDFCWEVRGEFTPMQVERMYRHWLLYRDHTTSCGDTEDMEIEIVLTFDRDHAFENRVILEDNQGFVVFDSDRDHIGAVAFFLQEVLFFDLCVPRTATYFLTVLDSEGDGFDNGELRVYRDGDLLQAIVGGSSFRKQRMVIPPASIPFAVTAPPGLDTLLDAIPGGRLRGNASP